MLERRKYLFLTLRGEFCGQMRGPVAFFFAL
jgi:hypothetical protein